MTVATGTLQPMLAPALAPDRTVGIRWWGRLYLPTLVVAGATTWLLWIGADTLHRSGRLGAGLAAGRAELIAPMVVVLIVVIVVCERRWPVERREALALGHVHDAIYFGVHVIA